MTCCVECVKRLVTFELPVSTNHRTEPVKSVFAISSSSSPKALDRGNYTNYKTSYVSAWLLELWSSWTGRGVRCFEELSANVHTPIFPLN